MQFIYHELASQSSLLINDEVYKYLFKVRRHKVDDLIALRNMEDHNIYFYKVENINKKDAMLTLSTVDEKIVDANYKLHMGWCVVDPKTIEKQLPYLNELGIDAISFIYADYSQKNFKINFDKLRKIVINSSQQCGRSSLIKFNIYDTLDLFLEEYPHAFAFNFSDIQLEKSLEIQTIVVGCEGGFSAREIDLFEKTQVVGINSSLILRSETAVTTVAAKLIV